MYLNRLHSWCLVIVVDFKVGYRSAEKTLRGLFIQTCYLWQDSLTCTCALSVQVKTHAEAPRAWCERGSCKQRWRALTDFGPQWGDRKRPAVQSGSKATSLQLSFNCTCPTTGTETLLACTRREPSVWGTPFEAGKHGITVQKCSFSKLDSFI